MRDILSQIFHVGTRPASAANPKVRFQCGGFWSGLGGEQSLGRLHISRRNAQTGAPSNEHSPPLRRTKYAKRITVRMVSVHDDIGWIHYVPASLPNGTDPNQLKGS